MTKKFLAFMCMAILLITPSAGAAIESSDIVILYTNDVHCGVDDYIGYAGLSYYRSVVAGQTSYDVTLVDAGDWAQGGNIGSLSRGEKILEIMNAVGYDVAVPGNHEFDYGWAQFMKLGESLDCGFISSNLLNVSEDALVFKPYKIFTYGDIKVAFVGACTPESVAKSTPAYFKDDDGNYLYDFQGTSDDLVTAIQNAVNDAIADSADYVVVVGHLGEYDDVTEKWSAPYIAARTTGINVFIDGHSHEVTPHLIIQNASGDDVIITQTGTELQYIGQLTIASDGTISTDLIGASDIASKDSQITALIDGIKEEYDDLLSTKLSSSTFDLNIYEYEDDGTRTRLVRNTDLGIANLLADAMLATAAKTSTGYADIAFVNGGGIRTDIKSGDITFGDINDVMPFSNTVCMIEATGQTILDELEVSARLAPDENGGFLHAAGLSYVIDVRIPTPVVLDEHNLLVKVSGDRRVRDVLVNGEPIDPAKKYKVISLSYVLIYEGDGHMFYDSELIEPEFGVDAYLISDYIKSLDIIPTKYARAEGRVKTISDATIAEAECTNGTFAGLEFNKVISWKGIPYAQPPVGSLRWKAPVSPDADTGTYDAFSYGPMPIQKVYASSYVSRMPQDEDCLYLNVVKASDDSTALKPVMVWIHGGAFKSGGTGNPEYSGQEFIEANPGVIFVSVGYRHNLMGYIDFSQVPGGEDYPDSGNLSLLDMVQALKWLKENISAFGGDPDNITLFGQSSGSASIALLMTMPQTHGLFKRAILESGTVSMVTRSADCVVLAGKLLELTGKKDMAGLMALTSRDLQDAADKLDGYMNFPELDGRVLTAGNIYDAFGDNAGEFDLLIGTNADEVRYWLGAVGGDTTIYGNLITTAYNQTKEAIVNYAAETEAVFDGFIALQEGDNPVWKYTEFFNDLLFRGPAIQTASYHVGAGEGKTYMYYWEHYPQGVAALLDVLRACHASEIPYIMNAPSSLVPEQILEASSVLARGVQNIWVAFASTGTIPFNEYSAVSSDTTGTITVATTGITDKGDPHIAQTRLIANLLPFGISGREIINAISLYTDEEDDSGGDDTPVTPVTPVTPPVTPITPVTPDNDTVKAELSAPSQAVINILTNSSTRATVIEAMNNKLSGSGSIPADATYQGSLNSAITAGNSTSIAAKQSAAPANEEVVFVVEDFTVSADGLYTFGLSLDLEPETKLNWHCDATVKTGSVEVVVAADEETAAVFMDDEGEITEIVPKNRHVNIAAYFEKDKTYSPYITASEEGTSSGPGDSGGGCNSGMAALMLLLIPAVIIKKK